MRVKMCGFTNIDDVMKAAYNGAWAVGFVFHKKSPRYVSPSKVQRIVEALPPFVTPVGVFVDLKEGAVRNICQFTKIRTVQFHGSELPAYCKRFTRDFKVIKAFRIHDLFDFELLKSYLNVNAYLFDTYQEDAEGGTGKTFNWNLLKNQKFTKPFILSGGLNSENVIQAIQEVAPYAVDISSGIERKPGIKDHRLIKSFLTVANHTHLSEND